MVDDTAVDAAFEAADVVIAQRMVNQRLAPSSIEARGVVAHYEPGREALTVWSSTQNPHILRTFMAQLLELGEDRVRAIAPEVGGGFGAKINIYGEEYVAAALSKRLGLPIKWIEDRSEAFLATVHGRDLIGYVELAATRDGKVLGLRMRIIADIGAYNMLLTARVPTHSMTDGQRHLRVSRHPRDADRRSSPTRPRPMPIAARGGPRRLTSSSGRWTCWLASWRWTRPSCAGRTSSSPTSSPTGPRWGRSTIPATTRRRSTTP